MAVAKRGKDDFGLCCWGMNNSLKCSLVGSSSSRVRSCLMCWCLYMGVIWFAHMLEAVLRPTGYSGKWYFAESSAHLLCVGACSRQQRLSHPCALYRIWGFHRWRQTRCCRSMLRVLLRVCRAICRCAWCAVAVLCHVPGAGFTWAISFTLCP